MTSKTPTGRRRTTRPDIRGSDAAANARELYRREKARRAGDPHPERDLLDAAKREYLALLAEGVAKGKGGRPKKKPLVRPSDTDEEGGELESEAEPETDEE